MKIEFNIKCKPNQGMDITKVFLYLGEYGRGIMKITVKEDGFSDRQTFTVPLNHNKIEWKPGHFWVQRFFNETATQKVLDTANGYFDRLTF